ncbi:MAG: FAD-binding protein [Deltaproteobacteria bacterium]|nr:FAD-binding protein [Deltaproteobacteria bacterium]
MYDVAIIGGGPAGATLARLIGDRYKVLLIEHRRLADPCEGFSALKCCGGLLAPDAQMMLSKLGLGLPKSVLEDPQLFVVKSIDIPQRLERYYQRHYINMNRKKFDAWLLSLVPANVDIRTGCRFQSFADDGDGFKLTLTEGKKRFDEKARFLVGADGAKSKVREQFAGRIDFPERYVAIQEWVERKNDRPYFTSIFDTDITDYYCWTIPKGNHLLIGAALPYRQKAAKKFALLKTKLKAHGMQFGKTVFREGTLILRPRQQNQLSTGCKGIALLGEAGGWISPSSAEGLSYAFKSALMLAEALQSSPEGFEKRYDQTCRQLRKNIFLKNVKTHFIFRPLLRNIIMRSGLQSLTLGRH